MTERTLPWWILSLSLLAGCSVSPPQAIETDPSHEGLRLAQRLDWRAVLIATEAEDGEPWRWGAPAAVDSASATAVDSADLAALDSTTGEVAALDSGAVASADSADSAVAGPRLPPRVHRWSAPPPAAAELGERIAAVCSWALTDVPQLALDAGDPGSELGGLLLAAAAGRDAELLIHVDLLEQQVAWVERDSPWFWIDAALFYGPGLVPVVLIADEVYEVGLAARVSVVHVGSGRALLERDFVVSHRRALNDPERGWSVSGLLFLYPYTLDADAYADVREALWPHAQEALALEVLTWLREALPPRLAEADALELREPATDEEPEAEVPTGPGPR